MHVIMPGKCFSDGRRWIDAAQKVKITEKVRRDISRRTFSVSIGSLYRVLFNSDSADLGRIYLYRLKRLGEDSVCIPCVPEYTGVVVV